MTIFTDISVEYIHHYGSDTHVCNVARVTLNKWQNDIVTQESNNKLIRFLAQHNHWTPFAHSGACFRINAPVFVARQLIRHTVGFVWNEVSRRYVRDEIQFYKFEKFRLAAPGVKQGSSKETTTKGVNRYRSHCLSALDLYNQYIEEGIAPEVARAVLPHSLMTQWIWTGSLMAFSRFVNLRMQDDAQQESGEVASLIDDEMARLFPVSWSELSINAH